MNLDDGLLLHAKIVAVRNAWLEIQRLTAPIDDHELYLSISSARMSILDVKDRLEQLLTEGDLEPEQALA